MGPALVLFAEFYSDLVSFLSDPPRMLEWDMLVRILIQIVLFGASAFFSGSETALFSLTRFDLQRLARAKHPAADRLQRLLEQPRRLIVSILCGNELINITAAANMTAILIELMGVEAAAWIAAFIMIPLILVFGEVTPKTLAVNGPVWVSTRIVATPMSRWVQFSTPLTFLVRLLADRVTTLVIGRERTKENILHVDELKMLIEEGVESGEITATERLLVQGLLSAGATEVRKIMTPRVVMDFIDGDLDSSTIRQRFFELRHSCVPVYRGKRDHVEGFLYAEDLIETKQPAPASDELDGLLHPPLAVPITKQVDEMLDFFDVHDARAALVVNEFGTIEGIVTLSDVTRLLFDEIFEGAQQHQAEISERDGGFDIDGRASLTEVRKATGIDISDPVMTTIAGAALRSIGHLPNIGERTIIDGYILSVMEMEEFRITRVHVQRDEGDKDQEDSSS